MSLELNSQPPAAPSISSCLNYKCPDKEAKRELNQKFCQKRGLGNLIDVIPCEEECLELQEGWAVCVKAQEFHLDYIVAYPGERCDGSDSVCKFGPKK